MPRLYRPAVPIEVKCRVALRQLGEMWPDAVIEANRADPTVAPTHRKGLGTLLSRLLPTLATLIGCHPVALRLDHDPALGLRKKRQRGKIIIYTPDANDPEFLIYRDKHGHHIKTNVRGDGAQFSDTVLMKRERRRRKKNARRNSRKLPKPTAGLKRRADSRFRSSVNKSAQKRKWPSRPFPKRKLPSQARRVRHRNARTAVLT